MIQKNSIHELELDKTLEKVQVIFTVLLFCLLPWALVRTLVGPSVYSNQNFIIIIILITLKS